MVEADTFDAIGHVAWVMEDVDLERMLDAIETATEVVMDLENTGLDEHAVTGGKSNGGIAARVVLASLTLPQPDDAGDPTTWILPLSHPDSPWSGHWRATFRRVNKAIAAWRKAITNHNLKYDLRWSRAMTGVDLTHLPHWCTAIASHLQDENRSNKLKDIVPVIFDVERWDDFDLTTPGAAERVPLIDLGLYAARDTYWTWRLAQYQRRVMFLDGSDEAPEGPEEVEDARLGRLATWVAQPTSATLTAIEQRGMALDEEWVRESLDEHETGYADLFAELANRYATKADGTANEDLKPDGASFAPTALWFGRWAQEAVDRGDLRVASLTPKGKPQWSKNVLARQARNGSETAEKLLALRQHSKRAEFLRSWLYHLAPDGRIYCSYNAGSVVTGRLSSSDPNMQQVTKALRPAFVASDGYVIIDLDYSQLELRIAAFLSRSWPMIWAFQEGRDLHRMLATRITDKPEDQVTDEDRQKGKSANFGLLYLMGAFGFREYAEDVYGVVLTMEEAQVIHRAFFEMWDGIKAWHIASIKRVHDTGQVVSPIGRVRRLPGIWDANERVVGYSERASVNAPVQGFGSDLMQIAASLIEGTNPGSTAVRGARLVGTVHDSILVEAPADDWQRVMVECQERMTVDVLAVLKRLGCDFDVPLVADAKVGTRWGLSDVSDAVA